MKKRKSLLFALAILLLAVGVFAAIYEKEVESFVKMKFFTELNEKPLLKTKELVGLLKDEGVPLRKVKEFPLPLADCELEAVQPAVYQKKDGGAYYLFYEYTSYKETGTLKNQLGWSEFPGNSKEFSRAMISVTAGKNIVLCLWIEDADFFGEKKLSERDLAFYETIWAERTELIKVLQEKAFNMKKTEFRGSGEFWEAKIPVQYLFNTYENENSVSQIQSWATRETLLKYLGDEESAPSVYEIRWDKGGMGGSSMNSTESLLRKKEKDGFYRITDSQNMDFNPYYDGTLFVTIIWGDGQSEKITCTRTEEEK